MKKINFIKFGLDILMAIILVLLFNKLAVVPMTFHEIAGLAIGVAFIIHIALNFKWVKQVTLKLFSSKTNARTRFGYIIDMLLLICFIIIIISGILISKIVFPNARINSSVNFTGVHIAVSYIALLLVGVHIGLHWTWAMNVFKKILGITEKKKIYGFIAKLAVVLLFVFGSYNIYSVQYFSKVSSIATSFSGNQHQMGGGGTNKAPQNGKNGQQQTQGSTSDGGNGQQPTQGGTAGGENGQRQMQGGAQHGNGGQEGKNGSMASPNILGIISTYISIISVFSIITFYLDKLLVKRKANNS